MYILDDTSHDQIYPKNQEKYGRMKIKWRQKYSTITVIKYETTNYFNVIGRTFYDFVTPTNIRLLSRTRIHFVISYTCVPWNE